MDRRPSIKKSIIISAAAERDKCVKGMKVTEKYIRAGFYDIKTSDSKKAPGLDIHPMGRERMGKDPKISMLNKWHQFHNYSTVFVTVGACMTSTSPQNPSLTYKAFTARAVYYAVSQLKKEKNK